MRYAVIYETVQGDIGPLTDEMAYIMLDGDVDLDRVYAELRQYVPHCYIKGYVMEDDDEDVFIGADWI